MYDEPHVRPIDAHPERDGGHDDIDALVEERVLILAAVGVREPRVIRQGRRAQPGQPFGQPIHLPTGRAVDDARLVMMPLEHGE